MTKFLSIVAGFGLAGAAFADQSGSSERTGEGRGHRSGADAEARAEREMPWVGLQIETLDGPTRAHADEVPEGVGFLIRRVDDGGPAGAAGIRAYDILWKFDDQLLVNESQFATLLRLKKPGEVVTFSIMRSSRHREVELTLAEMPKERRRHEVAPEEVPLVPTGVPGMPRTIVYPQNRTAEVSRSDGSLAKLHYDDGEAQVSIFDAGGEPIYVGPVSDDGEVRVPKEWRCSVGALLRTMHRAEKSDWKPRRPRPRVVTPTESKEE